MVKEGKYYRYYKNNKPLKKAGKTINGRYYYFKANGNAAMNESYKVKGVYYVFDKKARRVAPGKDAIVTVNGEKYFVNKSGKALPGWHEIGSKMYYAYRNGKCAAGVVAHGVPFSKAGYAKYTNQVKCKFAARDFIAQHSKANASNRDKFYSCFRYIMAYTNFIPWKDPSAQELKSKEWVYKYALDMFQTGLSGSCYGIACCVAAVARELGYEPYVITIPDGHSFVMINGRYYDNMYGTLFDAPTRPAYTVEYKIKF
ncbi:MAG: hypothetical protein PUI16_04055 [Clostridia bacterium]|nr:hypothetical protein [Clostridia bacterium]MDY5553817.1 hypothetical protein [Blautia sp.]